MLPFYLVSLALSAAYAAEPYVNSYGGDFCVSANYPLTDPAPVFQVECRTFTGETERVETPFTIGRSKGWLRTFPIGGRCVFIKDGLMWDEQCDRNKDYRAWEWYYPTGARLKEDYCHNDVCGRCPKALQDKKWSIVPCEH